jgi:hypothetical protein
LAIKIEDGTVATIDQLLSGDAKTSNGTAISSSQVGSTNTYTATVALNDGTGRNEIFRFDKPDNAYTTVTVSRKVQ